VPPDTSTPADRLRAIFERGRGRLLTRDLLHGVAAGASVVAAGIAMRPAVLMVVAAGLGIAATVVALRRHLRTTSRVAVLIERGDPALRNLVITAEELLRYPNRSAQWIGQRVFEDAAARLSAVDLGAAVPLGRAAAAAGAALLLAGLMPVVVRTIDGRAERHLPAVAGNPARGASAIEVRLNPPSYSRRPPAVLTNPARIDALEGTRLTLVVTNPPGAVQVRFGDRQLPVSQRSDGWRIDLTLVEGGYFAIESGPRETAREPVRLIAVAVTPDRAPDVRVERPGRDLLLPDVRAVVDVAAVAADDIGLAAMALRYTKVSGSGEQFEFEEGELPLEVVKSSPQGWQARGRIPVATLGLEPGDSLVYRLTARDGRPGLVGTGSSDTFFVEIAGPGQVALEGFEMPPEQERYALSQQMIVVKLRRLREREKAMTPAVLDEHTGAIAAEQRAVRGNFVFLMGGHVEDEEEEAEQSHEIQEGRLANTARREIWRAVAHMTSTEQALAAHDTAAALAAAMQAVGALQKAFTRNRYILRTLPSRLRIDPSRRLSGALDDVKDEMRAMASPAVSPDAELSRRLLAETIALIPRLRSEKESAAVVATLSAAAERALAASSGDPEWSGIAQSLLRLRGAVSSGAAPPRIDAESLIVVQALLQRVRKDAAVVQPRSADRLERAWADEARRR
jgi:hypothetical protein